MSWFTQLEKLSDIPACSYEGYLWQSDKDAPERIGNIPAAFEKDGIPSNPFILESHLFCREQEISVSVRHSQGRYLIHLFELKKIPTECVLTVENYLAHQALGGSLSFKEVWVPEKDDNCAGMDVLTKSGSVFTGFTKEQQQ